MNRKFISNSNTVLRKIFNSNKNIDVLKNLIESLLGIEIEKIVLNPYLYSKSKYLPKEENFGIADTRVTLTSGQELNIGIQFIDGYYVQNKILLYYAQIHTNQLEYNKRKIAKTITINLLDFIYFNSKEYHKKILIKPNTNQANEIDDIELHVFELPKFKNANIIKDSEREAWLSYFCGEKNNFFEMAIKKYKSINKLDRLLNYYWENEKME